MSRRIVITGASGNIGTAVLRRLAVSGGHKVLGISRRHPPERGVYRYAQWHRLDLADDVAETALRGLFEGADVVIHLAWGFQPTRNVGYLDAVGIGGTRKVLDAAHAAGVGHLVHMSSIGAYAPGRYGHRVDETWSTAGIPTSAYSRAKSAAEALLDDYERDHGTDAVRVARLRPALVVQRDAASGLRRYMLPGYVSPKWLRWLPVLPLDRSLVVQFVHADDVAAAVAAVVERGAAGPFNLAAEPPVRRDDIAGALGARPVHVPSGLMRPVVKASWLARLQPIDQGWFDLAFSVPLLNTDRARTELGWQPEWDSMRALSDVGLGFLVDAETESPVLRHRSAVEALRRDVAAGPLTSRHIP